MKIVNKEKYNLHKTYIYLKEWVNISINVKPAKLTVDFRGCIQSNLFLQKNKHDTFYISSQKLGLEMHTYLQNKPDKRPGIEAQISPSSLIPNLAQHHSL